LKRSWKRRSAVPDYLHDEEEFTTGFNGKTVLRMFGEVKAYWPRVLAFCCLIAMVSVGDGFFTFLNKRIIDEAIVAHDPTRLVSIALLFGAIILGQAVAVFGMVFFAGILGERVQYDLRKKMFDHLQELSFSYYDRTPVGWIMARVTSDSGRIAGLITWGLNDVCWALTNIVSSSIFMFLIDWRLASIIFVAIPFLVVVAVQFKNRIVGEYRKVRRLNSKITAAYNENITGMRVVKALCREEKNLQEFSRLTGDMRAAGFRAAWLSALFLPLVQIISALAIGAIVWFGGLQARWGLISVGGIQAFLGYVTFMMWPVQDLARVYADMQQSIASAERTFSLIDAVPDITDTPDAGQSESGASCLGGDIDFDHVDFHYQEGKPVLHDFTLHVGQGETIALVGPTGGGKSTIVNLMCRFYEPQGGTIRLAGRDYLELPLHAIQSRIGMVLQTPHLFSGSVRENIRYGRLDATDAEIEEAAAQAGAHEFIQRLEKGYDGEVGEGGNRLSVGQKQLISLARAILARPEVFIMDEATSSVDTLTESLIQRGMVALMRGRTSFLIAHRLSTIKRADRIVVIDSGKIAEMGTHHELIQARGHYYELYTRQFRHEREEGQEVLELLGSDAAPS
jgi:ATP-binding cassette subfamily B protein